LREIKKKSQMSIEIREEISSVDMEHPFTYTPYKIIYEEYPL
jgi:hypothetical protein